MNNDKVGMENLS